ncbi:MAG: hypothetical protein JWO07_469 [Candidatus Saccharibacteria bacterium]|nr:hypothetical protein [Candidatus Saccharibacteria bacterium]
MGYKELIKKMQQDSGLSSTESKESMELMVESIAERLGSSERHEFAEQLPEELQEVAMTALPAGLEDGRDILHEFMEKENVQEEYATKQINAAWQSLKSLIGDAQLSTHIRTFIPATVIAAM